MKKFLSVLLTLCLMLTMCGTGLMSLTAFAAEKIDDTDVTWSFNNIDKTLTFEGKGAIPDYDNYTDEDGKVIIPWAGIDFTTVIFGEEITGIGNFAFYNSMDLENVTIPETVTSLGKGAFLNCKGLREITIEGALTKIDSQTFASCSSLEKVTLPTTITEIGAKAFYRCSSLKTIDLPDAVETIGESAFSQCILLEKFDAPKALQSIGGWAFYCCEKLSALTLSENTTSIGASAFDGCDKLASVAFPAGTKTVSEAAFSGCYALAEALLPEGLKTIESDAFYLCRALKSITIPHSVDTIAKKSVGFGRGGEVVDGFVINGYDGTAAEKYAAENNIKFNSLGDFYAKSGKISDTLSWSYNDENILTFEGSGEIGDYSIYSLPVYMNSDPAGIVFSDGITAVGAFSFFGNIKEIEIPETITSIGDKAFGYCFDNNGKGDAVDGFAITGYVGSAAQKYADDNAFAFTPVKDPLIYEGSCGENATWKYDEETKTLTISGTGAVAANTKDEPAYYLRYEIAKVVVEDGITSIGDRAFETVGDDEIVVTLPKSVETIGQNAVGFFLATEEDGTTITEKVNPNCTIEGFTGTAAEKYAADNEIKFTALAEPPVYEGSCGENATWKYDEETKTLTISGTGAVAANTKDEPAYYLRYEIAKVVVEDGITSIGDRAFETVGDDEIVVTLPKSVETIGQNAVGFFLATEEDGTTITEKVNPNCTIEGFTGTAAEKYAADNEIKFVSLDPQLDFSIKGDAKISVFDAENKIITVYDNKSGVDALLADFNIGKDLTVEAPEKIATGAKLVTKNGEEVLETYTIILMGDVNGDGAVNSIDALSVLNHSVERALLEGVFLAAADLDANGTLNSFDALNILQIAVESKSLLDFFPKATTDAE